MSGQRHPDTEALASLRAGLIRGLRGRRLAAHVGRCDRCASVSDELGAVSSMLASAPAPTLPEPFESRIAAALGAEAAARESAASAAGATPAGAGTARGDAAKRATPPDRPRPAPARHRQPGWRFRPAMAAVPVIALVLAGFGYLLSNSGPSSSSSSAASEAGPQPAAASASGPGPADAAPAGGAQPPADSRKATFVVTMSGTRYEAATLRAQVLSMLAARSGTNTVPSAVPSPGASSPAAGFNEHDGTGASAATAIPSRTLTGCALSLTGNVRPSLVDQATYDGKAAYVIAVPGHAWVVGLGCTASNHELIASVALTGTP